jgi:anti-sigma regulatory factor (Ser/Thr protein kinase)
VTNDVTVRQARGTGSAYPRSMSSVGGSGRGPDDPWTTLHLPFDTAAPRAARRHLLDDLTKAGLRDAVIVDAQVVLAELVNNGVEHGEPGPNGTIEISWRILDDHLRLSVCDGGSASELRPMELTDDRLRGRGLAIIDQLADRWTFDATEGTRITVELDYSTEGAVASD